MSIAGGVASSRSRRLADAVAEVPIVRRAGGLKPCENGYIYGGICAICGEAMEGKYTRRLACTHAFHFACLEEWQKEKAQDPLEACCYTCGAPASGQPIFSGTQGADAQARSYRNGRERFGSSSGATSRTSSRGSAGGRGALAVLARARGGAEEDGGTPSVSGRDRLSERSLRPPLAPLPSRR
eukprot:TRINITY_DN57883_c0_g1_i3.p1 TRINITY_DN57883_c0_g1~~TRINITY_DN57883_c0_g1_i3.p1  ORF type:complete len:183 (-),score=30.59 TRINITY_DN57883_c0_g1_i3:56-604(-)